MSEAVIELLVKRKTRPGSMIIKCACIAIAVLFLFLSMFNALMILGTFAFGGLFVFVRLRSNVEYEYTYFDKELTIDVIYNQAKRKQAAKFEISRMEILAPYNSHQLDAYRNKGGKEIDYTSQITKQPDIRYMMVVDGIRKIVFEPNDAIVMAIRNVAPRKVFVD